MDGYSFHFFPLSLLLLLQFVLTLSKYSPVVDPADIQARCDSCLSGQGVWDKLALEGWHPQDNHGKFFKLNKRLQDPLDILQQGNYSWVAMLGDSNMRHLYYEVVGIICKKEIQCTVHLPNADPKKKKIDEDPSSWRSTLSDAIIKNDVITQAHQDHDVIFEKATGEVYRISFRMIVGEVRKTVRSLDRIDELFCISKEAGNAPTCDAGVNVTKQIPKIFRPCKNSIRNCRRYLKPDILYMNDGYWDFNNMLDKDLSETFFKKLGCEFVNTRVIWMTHYQIRLDIMRSFDKGHYDSFTKLGVPYAETVIDNTNVQRKTLAKKYGIEVLDVNKMQQILDAFYKASLGEQDFENAAVFSIDHKRDELSPDGVHQNKYFYGAVAKQMFINMAVCTNNTRARCAGEEDEWNRYIISYLIMSPISFMIYHLYVVTNFSTSADAGATEEPELSSTKDVRKADNFTTSTSTSKEKECVCDKNKNGDCESKGCKMVEEAKSDMEKFKEEFRKRMSGATGASSATPSPSLAPTTAMTTSGESNMKASGSSGSEENNGDEKSFTGADADESSADTSNPNTVVAKGAVVVPSVVEDESAAAANKDVDADPKPEEEAAAVEEGKHFNEQFILYFWELYFISLVHELWQ